jgi:hypothetical protein
LLPHSLCREQHRIVIRASIAAQTKSIPSKPKPKLHLMRLQEHMQSSPNFDMNHQ